MKHHGHPLEHNFHETVELPRPNGQSLFLTLQPLPLGFQQRLRSHHITPPKPPTKVARDSQGKPIRDDHGLAMMTIDEHDTHYSQQLEQYHQRVAVLSVVEALQADADVEMDSQPTDNNWTQYADDLYAEFQMAGFSAGDLIHLCNHICRMSNLIDQHLTETQANFSSMPPPTL